MSVSSDLVLRELSLDDAEDIFQTIDAQRDYLGRWLPFVVLTDTVAFTKSFIRSVVETPFENREHTFVVRYNDAFAGLVGFRDTDRGNRKTEIGYWLSEPFQHKGIATQSVQALLRFAFNDLCMNRIQIRCAVGNLPSKQVPKRLGFTFEGIERAAELFPDEHYEDLEVYSMLKSEFSGFQQE